MKTVWKYSLPFMEGTGKSFEVPAGGRIVHVGMDPVKLHTLSIWVEVRLKEAVIRTFEIFATGSTVPDEAQYVGTVQDTVLMLHLYEMPPRKVHHA